MRAAILLFLFLLLGVENGQADGAVVPGRVDRRPQLPGATTIAQQFNCPGGSVPVYPSPSTIMCQCPDGSYAGLSGCPSAPQENQPNTCMDSNANPDKRIAACSEQIANPLGFRWTCNHFVQGQLQTKPCDERGVSGIRGLLYNSRGLAYKAKGDLKSAITDFQQAVASAQFAGENRPNFERNLKEAQVKSDYDREYDQFVQQWQACFSGAASVEEANRNILMCNFAVSFPRIVPVDRDKLIQQRAALEGIKQAQLQQQRQAQEVPVRRDETPVVETSEIPVSSAGGWYLGWMGPLFRFIQANTIFAWTAGIVATGLLIWLFVSIISSTPTPILKHRAVVVGWMAIPAAIAGALYYSGRFSNGELYAQSFLVTWTDAFAALACGGIIRQRVLKTSAPAIPSLPFVALAFAALTFAAFLLFVDYGHVLETAVCKGYDPFPSRCWFDKRNGFFFGSFVLICLVLCGVVLPAGSNFIVIYDRLRTWVRRNIAGRSDDWHEGKKKAAEARAASRPEPVLESAPVSAREHLSSWLPGAAPERAMDIHERREETPQAEDASKVEPVFNATATAPAIDSAVHEPPPAEPAVKVSPETEATPGQVVEDVRIDSRPLTREVVQTLNLPAVVTSQLPAGEIPRVPASSEAMHLKMTRSQRKSLTGKVIFALNARVEVPAEERALIAKYRLGDTVIYDSAARKRHTEAALGHLENTRDNSKLSDSAGALRAAGKTAFNLARAGARAAMAALSLRITINSLMKGVHVECKDLDELLGAKAAIGEAAENLRSYLDVAATFDGREEIIEF
jgi:hypothetical protein